MKGIILAGGSGTRLAPMTRTISKQLLPVYDKPLIFYPLSTLMLMGIRDILIISTPRDLPAIEALLGDGKALGLTLQYAEQPQPEGIAQAFLIGASFIGDESVCLILGDNLFHGHHLAEILDPADHAPDNAVIHTYRVNDPERYGVMVSGKDGKPEKIVEKPKNFLSRWAVTGLYIYPPDVAAKAKTLTPSARGELEITDLNNLYLAEGRLDAIKMGRGVAWLDAGTPESLLAASQFVHALEQRQSFKIACIEEIAWRQGFITAAQLEKLAESYGSGTYGAYLRMVLEEE